MPLATRRVHDSPGCAADRTIPEVAYDEDLADRIREVITATHTVTEQKMFGGLAFLIGGNMAIAASGEGGLLVRIDPRESARLLATTNAQEMEMRGRPMTGHPTSGVAAAAPPVKPCGFPQKIRCQHGSCREAGALTF